MATKNQSNNARFQRGSGVYVCRCCSHNTRSTGGDGAGVQLCDLCFDLAGEENHVADNGKTYESSQNVCAQLSALDSRNGAGTSQKIWPEVCKAAGYAN